MERVVSERRLKIGDSHSAFCGGGVIRKREREGQRPCGRVCRLCSRNIKEIREAGGERKHPRPTPQTLQAAPRTSA